jgi:DNA-binding MarR family transcriptional regulator
MAKNSTMEVASGLQDLADFRYELRRFLLFSEGRAVEAGLQPQQHQLLLQLAGAPYSTETTVSYAAERLGLRHHTVVELSKRCEEAGLINRTQDQNDRRRIRLQVTEKGRRVLRVLSQDHARELYELAPWLIRSLSLICSQVKNNKQGQRITTAGKGSR